MIDTKSKFHFEVNPWFECFFALQVFTDESSRIHDEWKRQASKHIPASFHQKFAGIGASPFLWPVLADAALIQPATLSFEERLSALADLPIQDFQKLIVLGIFHELPLVKKLLSGEIDLSQAITKVSKSKREWLAFLGLYPHKKSSPLFQSLQSLMRTPMDFQQIVLDLVETFWNKEFKETWERIYEKFERSKEEKERLFQSCSLKEFVRLALLRVEVDERKALLKAVRGGYTLPLKNLSRAVVLPSAFNDKRHWTASSDRKANIEAYFPYFDPAISLTWLPSGRQIEIEEPESDPALIFKALGDTTRYAMASVLAKNELTSASLAKMFGLSRPTVSHHIHALREAGLLDEKVQGNTVVLSLKRKILERLSELVVYQFFEASEEINLKKTRKK